MSKKEEKDRSRERKKRGNRKYGQAKLKHAKKGIWSCIVAGTVFVLSVILLIVAYTSGGTAAGYIGGLGLITIICSGVGIYLARKGFRERDKDYLTCKIGLACNTSIFLAFVAIFCWGLF